MTYTKGPWVAMENGWVEAADGDPVCMINEGGLTSSSFPQDIPNAHLIAAAPELLEALKELYNAIDSCVDLTPEVMQKCSKALNKAKGNTQ